MPKRSFRGRKTRVRRNVKRRSSTTAKNTRAIKTIKRKLTRGDLTKIRIEYQSDRRVLDPRWNRRILIDPQSIESNLPGVTPTWKYVFGATLSEASLKEKPDCYIHSLDLTQHFKIKELQSPDTQGLSPYPVTIHNYVVSLKQDFGAAWKGNGTQGTYDPTYLKEDLHYAMMGSANTNNDVLKNSQMFFLNKKLFNVHAEHHHEFSPAWLKQYKGQVSTVGTNFEDSFGLGFATNKSAYMVTWKDKIKLKIKLSARGNVNVGNIIPGFTQGPGWTGIRYQDVAATDQLFTITWCSQGGGGADVGTFDIYEQTAGIFNVSL